MKASELAFRDPGNVSYQFIIFRKFTYLTFTFNHTLHALPTLDTQHFYPIFFAILSPAGMMVFRLNIDVCLVIRSCSDNDESVI